MWTIVILIYNVRITKEAVLVAARFTAKDGPYAGQSIERQFTYTHPTTALEIETSLTDFGQRHKQSLMLGSLDGRTWEV